MGAMLSLSILNHNKENTRQCILEFIEEFSHAVFLDSNTNSLSPVPITGIHYDFIAAAGVHDLFTGDKNSLRSLQQFIDHHKLHKNWIFGYLSYDVKNEIEKLNSSNRDRIGFPEMHFFVPEYLILSRNGEIEIFSKKGDAGKIYDVIFNKVISTSASEMPVVHFTHHTDRENYLSSVNAILERIKRGDIYEINYCHQMVGIAENFIPEKIYGNLVQISPNPFSCYLKIDSNYLLCASPERFVMKKGNRIISQPVKGTAARGKNPEDDFSNKHHLAESAKERSENVMIVDLVRNDLSKFAVKGSVKVDELFGVYTFPRVHQMISTVSCEINNDVSFTDIIRSAFPMGSMTGAPKVSAMKIIEQYEDFKRGLFSGTVGYIDPEGDFDFNVIIRSVLYNSKTQTVALAAGGAITAQSDPAGEYNETLLKLKPQLQALGINTEQFTI